jgi:hypothetical protein
LLDAFWVNHRPDLDRLRLTDIPSFSQT